MIQQTIQLRQTLCAAGEEHRLWSLNSNATANAYSDSYPGKFFNLLPSFIPQIFIEHRCISCVMLEAGVTMRAKIDMVLAIVKLTVQFKREMSNTQMSLW